MLKKIREEMKPRKTIALIAHDGMKEELLTWCLEHKEVLSQHDLVGTGTTAGLIEKWTSLPVKGYASGPLGGDAQVTAAVVEGHIDVIIFFPDPLAAQPHDPDVKALLRIAQLYDVPMAVNVATANFLLTSPLLESTYFHDVIDVKGLVEDRISEIESRK